MSQGWNFKKMLGAFIKNNLAPSVEEMSTFRGNSGLLQANIIGDFVTKVKLHQTPGKIASAILEEFRQGSDPS